MVNINKILKQAQEMQEKVAREMESLEVEGSAGGGAVTVRMNGRKEVLGVSIRPEAVDPSDASMLEDLVKVAVNEAGRIVDEELSGTLGGAMPPGFPAR